MVQLAKAHNNVPLYTAYISRAYERTEMVRKLLFQDQIVGDKVTSITYTLVGKGGARGIDDDNSNIPWRLDASQSGAGLIMDVGCHVIDRIDYICNGPIINIGNQKVEKRDVAAPSLVEDFVHFQATIGPSITSSEDATTTKAATVLTEGAHVSCTWDFTGSTGEKECDSLTISGPKGSIQMTAMSPSLPVYVLDTYGNVIKEYTFDTPEHTAQPMIQAITDELLHLKLQKQQQGEKSLSTSTTSRSKPLISRGDNAIRTSNVLDQVLKTYYGNREIGFWENPESWPGRPKSS
jgi:1,5-anhydro-D-fructose reductase (1,5-anhydro-D-mannitol-forming)